MDVYKFGLNDERRGEKALGCFSFVKEWEAREAMRAEYIKGHAKGLAEGRAEVDLCTATAYDCGLAAGRADIQAEWDRWVEINKEWIGQRAVALAREKEAGYASGLASGLASGRAQMAQEVREAVEALGMDARHTRGVLEALEKLEGRGK